MKLILEILRLGFVAISVHGMYKVIFRSFVLIRAKKLYWRRGASSGSIQSNNFYTVSWIKFGAAAHSQCRHIMALHSNFSNINANKGWRACIVACHSALSGHVPPSDCMYRHQGSRSRFEICRTSGMFIICRCNLLWLTVNGLRVCKDFHKSVTNAAVYRNCKILVINICDYWFLNRFAQKVIYRFYFCTPPKCDQN